MTTSKYFNFYPKTRSPEHELIDSLIAQAVRIKGEDCYYLPRESWSDKDHIYGEDASSKFTSAYIMEMIHNTVDQYQGAGDFFSKFGMQMRDNMDLTVSIRGWKASMDQTIRSVPREGDLVFVPSQRRIWEIKFVEQTKMFYTLGNREPYIFELKCELFQYSQEDIDTGVEEIDILEPMIAYTVRLNMITPGTGDFSVGEAVSAVGVTGQVSSWDYQNKVLDVINTRGEFTANTSVTGSTSNTSWTISTVGDDDNYNEYDRTDSGLVQDEAEEIINRSETNPFGTV